MESLQKTDILTTGHGEKFGFESPENSVGHPPTNLRRLLSKKLLTWGVEARGTCYILGTESSLVKERDVRSHSGICHWTGIHPVAVEDRTETHFIKIFFIWLSANTNIVASVLFSHLHQKAD